MGLRVVTRKGKRYVVNLDENGKQIGPRVRYRGQSLQNKKNVAAVEKEIINKQILKTARKIVKAKEVERLNQLVQSKRSKAMLDDLLSNVPDFNRGLVRFDPNDKAARFKNGVRKFAAAEGCPNHLMDKIYKMDKDKLHDMYKANPAFFDWYFEYAEDKDESYSIEGNQSAFETIVSMYETRYGEL